MKKIAVFASGSGTNFKAIVDSVKSGLIHAEVKLLVCDKEEAYVIKRAKSEKINTFVFNPKDYKNKEEYEKNILNELKKNNIEFIILAGYMRLIGKLLLYNYKNKIINIHPSLLPAFKGKDAIEQAINYGVRIIGVTVHYVDEGIDTGRIIAQDSFKIEEDFSRKEIQKKIHSLEHRLYPIALRDIINNQ